MVSRVNVICNRSAEIHFMYQNGTWIETENILLETVQARSVMFNFNAEHVTTVVQITSDGPFLVRIAYIYPIETQMSLFARALYEMELNQQLGTPV
jgi:predicted peptidase